MMLYPSQRIRRVKRGDVGRATIVDVDEHGSPVTLEAATWFVCFVPGLEKQWWHGFVHERHKHVFAMRPEPNGMWMLFEPWWNRLLTASITAEQARKFLTWAAAGDVLLVRELGPRQRLSDLRLGELRGSGVLSTRPSLPRVDAASLLPEVDARGGRPSGRCVNAART